MFVLQSIVIKCKIADNSIVAAKYSNITIKKLSFKLHIEQFFCVAAELIDYILIF